MLAELMTDRPGQFQAVHQTFSGDLEKLEHPKRKPAKAISNIRQFEREIRLAEHSLDRAEGVVEFVKQAGLHDDEAVKFDEWTGEVGPVEAIHSFVKLVENDLESYISNLTEIVAEWNHLASEGLLEPAMPAELMKRVDKLEVRAGILAVELGKQHDNELIARLLTRISTHRKLTVDETLRLFDAVAVDVTVKEMPSVRRADWYGDDGR